MTAHTPDFIALSEFIARLPTRTDKPTPAYATAVNWVVANRIPVQRVSGRYFLSGDDQEIFLGQLGLLQIDGLDIPATGPRAEMSSKYLYFGIDEVRAALLRRNRRQRKSQAAPAL